MPDSKNPFLRPSTGTPSVSSSEENPFGRPVSATLETPERDRIAEISYGYSSGSSFSESLGNILETRNPLGRLEIFKDENGKTDWERIGKTILMGPFMAGAVDMAQDKSPFGAKYVPPSREFLEQHNRWKNNPTKAAEIEMLETLEREKTLRLEKRYEGDNIGDEDSWYRLVGNLGSFMADPTTAIPLGQGAKAGNLARKFKVLNKAKEAGKIGALSTYGAKAGMIAKGVAKPAVTGGALAGMDSAAYQYSQKGLVDYEDVAVAAVLGTAITGTVMALGKGFMVRLKNKVDDSIPVDIDDLSEFAPNMEKADAEALLDNINRRFGLTDYGKKPSQWRPEFYQRDVKKNLKAQTKAEKVAAEARQKEIKAAWGKILKDPDNIEKLDKADWYATANKEVLTYKFRTESPAYKAYMEVQEAASDAKAAQMEKAWLAKESQEATDINMALTMERQNKFAEKVWNDPDIPSHRTVMEKAFDDIANKNETNVKTLTELLTNTEGKNHGLSTLSDAGQLSAAIRDPNTGAIYKGMPLHPLIYTKNEALSRYTMQHLEEVDAMGFVGPSGKFYNRLEAQQLVDAADSSFQKRASDYLGIKTKTAEGASSHLESQLYQDVGVKGQGPNLANIANNAQKGGATTNVLSGVAGAGIGGIIDGPEGAVLGAALGLGMPWAATNLYKAVGTLGNPFKWSQDVAAGWSISRPFAVMRKWGSAGAKFARAMEIARNNNILNTANKLADLEVVLDKAGLYKYTPEQSKMMVRYLQGENIKLPKNMKAAADYVKKELGDTLEEAHKVGIISKKRYLALKDKVKKEGYWPRVYDDVFLQTSEGQKLWVETLAGKTFSEESARHALKTILGEHSPQVDEVMKRMASTGGLYKMSPSIARDILAQRRRYVAQGRSVHMERSRKIHPETEQLLAPFMHHDLRSVLSIYWQDVNKRIEYAKLFGSKDEVALKMAKDILETQGEKQAKFSMENYYNAVGDPQSALVRQQIELNEGLRTFYQKADAFETLKLTFGAIPNVLQATLNGSVIISSHSANPLRAASAFQKGLRATFSAEGREFAKRTGAAFETTLMEYIGEMSNINHTLFNKTFTGIWSPLEIINNPTKYLKAVQFIRVEQFQRNLAANIGKAHAEELLARKKNMIVAGVPANHRKMVTVNKALEELGIGINKSADDVTAHEMQRAALRFSDMTNFTNAPGTMPLAWASPHAKVFRKFKTFAYNQGILFKDRIIKPAMRGNFTPLALWGAAAMGPGVWISDFRGMLLGKTPEERETFMERWFRGMTAIGGVGIFWDVASQTAWNRSAPAEAVMGPFASDALKLVHGTYKTLENKDAYYMLKAAANTMVYPGKSAVNEDWKSDKKKRKEFRARFGMSN